MVMYVLERFLARLSVSPYADRFILKGGMLLAVIGGEPGAPEIVTPWIEGEYLRPAIAST